MEKKVIKVKPPIIFSQGRITVLVPMAPYFLREQGNAQMAKSRQQLIGS